MLGMGLSNLNSSPIGMAANPPYIRFETRAIRRMKPAEQGGDVYFVNVDFALVTSHGSKDTVEKALPDWFIHLKEEVRQQRLPSQWLEAYEASYRAWKAGEELPIVGTPLKNWPVLSPAETKNLTEIGLRAVEDLAGANEELVARIGMGARRLVDLAKDWLRSQGGAVPIHGYDALRAENAGLKHRLQELEATVSALSAVRTQQIETPAIHLPPLEDRLLDAQAASSGLSEEELISDGIESTLEGVEE